MFHLIYRITNDKNGKFYIGSHSTENIYDDYFGSGHRIKQAIKKYGRANFSKQILHVFFDRKSMLKKERELVNETTIIDKNSYNVCLGGQGGTLFKRGHSEETKRKISILNKGRPSKFKGLKSKLTIEQRKEIARKTSLQWNGVPKSKEHKEKISKSHLGMKKPWASEINKRTKSLKIIFENKEYSSIREASRNCDKSFSYIQKHGIRI